MPKTCETCSACYKCIDHWECDHRDSNRCGQIVFYDTPACDMHVIETPVIDNDNFLNECFSEFMDELIE